MTFTLKDLPPGSSFKLYPRFRDGSRKPRMAYKAANKTRLRNAYLRVRNHALVGQVVVEITRRVDAIDFTRELVVVEHLRGGCTMVRDEHYRLAPMWSGLAIKQMPANANNNVQQRPRRRAVND